MSWCDRRLSRTAATVAGLALLFGAGTAALADGGSILSARCSACHADEGDGLTRIKGQRKTPEGWLMTIVRMRLMHGVEVAPGETRTLVKYLSDTQGLAPSESEPYRYILEREPAIVEDFAPEYFFMCARCHSGARGALQRRTKEEWRTHIHFHLGQWPTTEYQFYGRDRAWFQIATTETTDWLAEHFPFESTAWDEWKGHEVDISGEWRYVMSGPGLGFRHGILSVSGRDGDQYKTTVMSNRPDGSVVNLTGSGIVYTGYEARFRLSDGESQFLAVGAISEDGLSQTGRTMNADNDEMGFRYRAVKVRPGHSEIMSVQPGYVRTGAETTIEIHGTGLSGTPVLGSGIEVVETVSTGSDTVVLKVRAAADAGLGARSISVGSTASSADALVVYDSVAAVQVEPSYTIARVGEGGGSRPDQYALFDAVGYMSGPDSEAGTDDDVRIGVMPATWKTEPFDDVAKELDDVGFAGMMNPQSGIYDPADAGLNPARPFQTNNAGNLKVVGTVDDAGNLVSGEGQLIVTVQRWNDPPIR